MAGAPGVVRAGGVHRLAVLRNEEDHRDDGLAEGAARLDLRSTARRVIRATARWLASSLVLLFAVTVLTFLLSALAPGDAAKTMLSGQTTSYTPEQYRQLRHELGIDEPLPIQYWHWLTGSYTAVWGRTCSAASRSRRRS